MNFGPPKNLRIIRVRDSGVLATERVISRVLRPCNLGRYALIAGLNKPDGFHPDNGLVYWFPDVVAEAGDLVLVRTTSGTDGLYPRSDGVRVHVLYWGRLKPVWAGQRLPALVHISAAQFPAQP